MKLSIRTKLLGTYLLVLLVMGGVLFLYLNRTLEQQLVDGIRDNLRSQAGLAALTVNRELVDPERDGPPLAVAIGERIHARITLLSADGRVIGDSEVAAQELAALENHLDRPEIRAAVERGYGSAIRRSTTLREDMLYVAVRIAPERAGRGLLRLALPLEAVSRARSSLHQSLGVAFLLAALLAIGLSLLLTQFATRILTSLSEGAERFGAGDFRRKIPVQSADELGALGRVMNTMAERLQLHMEHLADERNRLDTILRGMGEGLLVADRDGTVRLINPAFRLQFGVGDEVVGHPLIELSRHPSLHENFRATLSERKTRSAEMTLGREGSTVLLAHWTPLLEEHRTIGVVTVFHDISELKRLERVRRDFVANVSHELRTPVTVINGYAETLAGGVIAKDPATAERFVHIIRTHAERLSALIGDLLTLSQLEVGGFTLELVPVELAERVRHACALLEPKAVAKGITLDCDVPVLRVLADPQRFEQILVNLLDNAIKYTSEGGTVQVSAVVEAEQARIEVHDSGVGIPATALPRLFERFYRVDAGRSRDAGGTGLGLAIVKHLVQLHGGSIEVISQPGVGSTFTVRLRRPLDTPLLLPDTPQP